MTPKLFLTFFFHFLVFIILTKIFCKIFGIILRLIYKIYRHNNLFFWMRYTCVVCSIKLISFILKLRYEEGELCCQEIINSIGRGNCSVMFSLYNLENTIWKIKMRNKQILLVQLTVFVFVFVFYHNAMVKIERNVKIVRNTSWKSFLIFCMERNHLVEFLGGRGWIADQAFSPSNLPSERDGGWCRVWRREQHRIHQQILSKMTTIFSCSVKNLLLPNFESNFFRALGNSGLLVVQVWWDFYWPKSVLFLVTKQFVSGHSKSVEPFRWKPRFKLSTSNGIV